VVKKDFPLKRTPFSSSLCTDVDLQTMLIFREHLLCIKFRVNPFYVLLQTKCRHNLEDKPLGVSSFFWQCLSISLKVHSDVWQSSDVKSGNLLQNVALNHFSVSPISQNLSYYKLGGKTNNVMKSETLSQRELYSSLERKQILHRQFNGYNENSSLCDNRNLEARYGINP
jgi:hypothetical protein